MSGLVVKCKLGRKDRRDTASAPPPSLTKPPSRTARQLALAYHIEQLVERGVLRDFAHAAQRLGTTRSRVSQIQNLLLLAPAIQSAIVLGELLTPERQLRRLIRQPDWKSQLQAIGLSSAEYVDRTPRTPGSRTGADP